MTDNERIEQLNKNVDKIKNTIHSSCDVHLFVDDFFATVDLINRIHEENKKNKTIINRADKLIDKQNAEINRQKAELSKKDTEIDILIRKKNDAYDENAELKVEIERLKDIAKGALTESIKLCDCIQETKAEAIKEFAEKLKKRTWDITYIDDLVKEMTE